MATMAPDDLRDADCPLLTRHPSGADLIRGFNEVAAGLRAANADPEVGAVVRTPEFAKAVLTPLTRVRRDMARPRYTVGFIGLSQAGKSTTVNNLLGDAEVCKSGTGIACSSQPARLVRAKAQSLDVVYLTSADYESRRLQLCKGVGLLNPGGDDDLLQQLGDDAVFEAVRDNPRLKKDREYLKKFLGAARKYGATHLSPEGRVDAGLPFADRSKYTTHTPGATEDQTLLIKEARLHLDLPTLPDDLEICDLPGLGSERTVDDVVTFDYLTQLTGALLFVNASMNMRDISLTDAINRFSRVFENEVGARAWVVFTRVDGLTNSHFRSGGENFFTVVSGLLADNRIPLSQVCFVSNTIHEGLLNEPPAERAAYAAKQMKQTPDKPVPETCPPELRPAWEALLADGGIGRLRKLITDDVGASLSAEIRVTAERDLERVRKELDKRVAAEKARQAGGSQLHEKVGTCRAAVMSLEQSLTDEPGAFGMLQSAEEFRARLRRLLDNDETRKVLAGLRPEKLPNEFRIHSKLLSKTFQAEVLAKILEPAYEQVGQRLDGLPRVPLGESGDCRGAWQAMHDEDGRPAADAWLGLPKFENDEVAQWLTSAADGGTVNGTVYLDLMCLKINSTIHATMHTLRGRLRARLGEMADDLERLTSAS